MSYRILLVAECVIAGVGRHSVDLSIGLADRGHEVHLIYSPFRSDPKTVAPLKAHGGIALAEVTITRNPGLSDISAFREIRRYIREHGPFDVVHGHSTKGALGNLAALGKPAARIYTAHGYRSLDPRLSGLRKLVISRIERRIGRLAHLVIAVSEDEKAHAASIGIDPVRLRCINNGVAPISRDDRDALRTRLGLQRNHVAIGFVGRFSSEKGPDRMIDAFADVAAKCADARLVMLGDGPMEDDVTAQADRRGVGDRVIWTGPVDGREHMPAFDILALPSAYEGLPYAVLEARAAGLPIVATKVGGVSTVVSDRKDGFVVGNWDQAAFADRLVELVDNGTKRAQMAAASLRHRDAFSIEQMIDGTLAVYAQAIDLAARRGAAVAQRDNRLPARE
jgi:glycosyltransferase involved in cell wall biosynthesis